MARRSSILASDADRERVAERLRQAATEGRILAHELEERVARALRARTYGELDVLVADLPRSPAPARPRSRALSLAGSHPVAAVVVLVTLTLMICVAAALAVFSGLPLLLLMIVFIRFGPWSRAPGRRGRQSAYRYGDPRYAGRRDRSPYWVR